MDPENYERKIYESEFRGWLPGRILDAHVHIFRRDSFPDGFKFPAKSIYGKFGFQHTVEQFESIAANLLPEHTVYSLSFGHPDIAADIEKAAAYTAEISDNIRRFGLTLVAPDNPVGDVRRRILEYKLLGYKPYRDLVRGKPYDEVAIFDMISREQMDLANELGLVIVFHIPRKGRLADPDNQREMVELCNRYPNAKIVWAHIGRAYCMRNVIGFLDGIASCPNAYLDTAMVNHAGVLEYAFRHFPRERILFGSDAPISWLLGKSVEINNQYAYIMGEDYAIGSAVYDAGHVVRFTSFFYEQLRGIKEAAEKAGLDRTEIENFFFNNAYGLLRKVAGQWS